MPRKIQLLLAILALAPLLYPSHPLRAEEVKSRSAALPFYDSETFDLKLSNLLEAKTPRVTVEMVAGQSLNDIHDRLDKWLTVVESSEGAVELRAEGGTESRWFGDIFLSLTGEAVDYVKDKVLYRPAKQYEATIYYVQGSGDITRIEFNRRPDSSSE